jgi:hypothetical protein
LVGLTVRGSALIFDHGASAGSELVEPPAGLRDS